MYDFVESVKQEIRVRVSGHTLEDIDEAIKFLKTIRGFIVDSYRVIGRLDREIASSLGKFKANGGALSIYGQPLNARSQLLTKPAQFYAFRYYILKATKLSYTKGIPHYIRSLSVGLSPGARELIYNLLCCVGTRWQRVTQDILIGMKKIEPASQIRYNVDQFTHCNSADLKFIEYRYNLLTRQLRQIKFELNQQDWIKKNEIKKT